ncbi:hypothetical protein P280DRAFT_516982 [Massarina eburnea CBS 473.64]|uniref:Uncharacterized protein n=1 Tax=Massarina eburnea CBS 473.64 TaxID=1395130 RepID=A0A6A6S5H2_9PLEO|nr:hypothetical protein P280DRAFT_516982 [Massarina eburnea CBS 473.64]
MSTVCTTNPYLTATPSPPLSPPHTPILTPIPDAIPLNDLETYWSENLSEMRDLDIDVDILGDYEEEGVDGSEAFIKMMVQIGMFWGAVVAVAVGWMIWRFL